MNEGETTNYSRALLKAIKQSELPCTGRRSSDLRNLIKAHAMENGNDHFIDNVLHQQASRRAKSCQTGTNPKKKPGPLSALLVTFVNPAMARRCSVYSGASSLDFSKAQIHIAFNHLSNGLAGWFVSTVCYQFICTDKTRTPRDRDDDRAG
jgi:hypothetical protein